MTASRMMMPRSTAAIAAADEANTSAITAMNRFTNT
jgi:hypothetical protein